MNYRIPALIFLAVAMIAAASPAQAATYEVGSCIASLPKFTTIQLAVNSVPPAQVFQTIVVRVWTL
jgi:hypothetical protein